MFKKITPAIFFLLLLSCGTTEKATNYLFINKKAEQKYITAYNNTMKLWPVPYTEKDIPTSFGSAHVIISGPANGEPLVLFHGLDASSTMWYPNIKSYAKKYRVYAVDHIIESGKSVSKDGKFTINDIVPWYNEVFDALNLKKIYLLGTSGGGWNATYYTIHSKGRVKKLVLLAPVETFTHITMKPKTLTAANFKFFPSRKHLNKMLNNFSQRAATIDPLFIDQMYLGTKNTKISTNMLRMNPFTDEEFKTLTFPVMVLIGDHDILNKPEVIDIASKVLPNVNAALIHDAGHFVSMDQQEEVDKRVMEFLQQDNLL